MVSVDIPAGSPIDVRNGVDVYTGRDRERLRLFKKDKQTVKLIDANSQHQTTVDTLCDILGTRPVDILFIDADHRYPGVKRDFDLYSPLVREGGLVAFHDVIRQNDPRSGVHLLWNELEQEYPDTYKWVGDDNWGMGDWGGIGVIRR
jgi:predicted O-methyltransferase YrrM